ncbi:protein enabled homolog [Eriocheir sinensis]|uniref:protein enabled homolog n=1 Tax=Eriocheir sinensis TaxID=95602 RepID=UPI0021CA4533|nr:protein enabled homolog [Eriocheir sinensis]
MASPNGRREGDEEAGKAEADASEVKPSQLDLLVAAVMAGVKQEMAVAREEHAERSREQARKIDELARRLDERAREQARKADERADELARRLDEQAREQARHLAEVLQSSLSSLKVETQQYTDKACDSVKSELLEEVQSLKGEVQGLREEVEAETQRREVATSHAEEHEASRVVAEGWLGSAWGPWQGPLGPRSVVSEPAADAGGWGAIGAASLGPVGAGVGPIHPASLPPSPPPSPPYRPAHSPRAPPSPPSSPSASRRSGRRKPAEYDGKVAWEAYVAQFEMLAAAQGWDEGEKALQLATALRGPTCFLREHGGGPAATFRSPPPGRGVPSSPEEADSGEGRDTVVAGAGRGSAGQKVVRIPLPRKR